MSTRRLVQNTIQSNLAIQHALAARASTLDAQLSDLDHLIESVTQGEDPPDEPLEAEFQVPSSKRATGPVQPFELLSPSSPFFKEASQRAYYVRWTSHHPMKGKEAEVLADAVKKENMRLEAYRVRDNSAAAPIDIETNIHGINWSIVAEKVSDYAPIKRTPDECRIQWAGKLHPNVNHGDWTQPELSKLHDLTAAALATGQKINWSGIAKELGTNRIPVDCMKQATAATRPRHHWDSNADQKLLEAVQIFGTNNWNLVARHVSPYATTSQCQTRYVRSLNPSIKREPWTAEEDTRLRKAVDAFNNIWIDIAGVLPGRTNEQCRERWAEIGTTEIERRPWSEVEEQQLLEAVKEFGKKWKIISEKLGSGRTGPNCRLRYGRLMKKLAKKDNSLSAPGSSEPASMMQISPPPTDPGSVYTPSRLQGKSYPATNIEGLEGDEALVILPSRLESPPQTNVPPLAPSKPRPRPRPRPRPLRRPDNSQLTEPRIQTHTALTKSGSHDEGASLEIHCESDHLITLPTLLRSDTAPTGPGQLDVASGSSSARGSTQPRIDPEQVDEGGGGKRKRAETETIGSNTDGVGDGVELTNPHSEPRSFKRRKLMSTKLVQDDVDENITATPESRVDDDTDEGSVSV